MKIRVDLQARTAWIRGCKVLGLTSTELRVLAYLADNQGKPVSRDTLLFAIWGVKSKSTRRVDVMMSRIRRKIELSNAHANVESVLGMGYII